MNWEGARFAPPLCNAPVTTVWRATGVRRISITIASTWIIVSGSGIMSTLSGCCLCSFSSRFWAWSWGFGCWLKIRSTSTSLRPKSGLFWCMLLWWGLLGWSWRGCWVFMCISVAVRILLRLSSSRRPNSRKSRLLMSLSLNRPPCRQNTLGKLFRDTPISRILECR